MKIPLLALFFILFINQESQIFGQVIVPDFTWRGTHEFRFPADNDNPGEHLGNIIREIANDADKSLSKTRFTGKFQIEVRIHDIEREHPWIRISITDWLSKGDVFYRGFDVSDVMVPDHISAVVAFIKRKDSTLSMQFRTRFQLLSGFDSITILKGSPIPDPKTDSMILEGLDFSFGSNSYSKFKRRIGLINDYYEASGITDSLLRLSGGIDFRIRPSIPLNIILLAEINKMTILIADRDFSGYLGLDRFDPLKLGPRFHELKLFSLSATMNLRDALEPTEPIVPPQSIDSLGQFFVSRMTGYIMKTLYGNWQSGSLFKEFLSTYFSKNSFENEPRLFRSLIQRYRPNENCDSVLHFLSIRLKGIFDTTAQELTSRHQFAEAVELLEIQRNFIRAVPFLRDFPIDSRNYSMAVTGIYNSYVEVAAEALRREKYLMAGQYLVQENVEAFVVT
ncbi:MAG: hypothetical protein WCL00_07960, partial [Bacteroidota bacterium]